jgi:regulator of sirC expression with transglutaminase-like and TPR domain
MSDHSNPGKISSLIRLIDDRDEFVRAKVKEQLLELGSDALPFLEIASRGESPDLRARAQEIIRTIQPQQLGDKFKLLVRSAKGGDLDLETGVCLIAEFGYPDLRSGEIKLTLDRLAGILASRVSRDDPPEMIVNELTRFLFQEQEFCGNQEDYGNPDNSFFNQVLKRRRGIPISLSALCVLISQRLELPIAGVGLPGHYIAKYNSPNAPIFFDPFNQGRRMARQDCMRIVQNLGHAFSEHHLSQASHRETLVRMMNNLIHFYSQSGENKKNEQLSEYVRILMNTSGNRSTPQH